MNQDKQQLWAQRIQLQKESSLSQKQWCQENDINFHTFSYWNKKVRTVNQHSFEEGETSWVTLNKTQQMQNQSSFRIRIGKAIIELNEPTEEMIHSVIRILMHHAH